MFNKMELVKTFELVLLLAKCFHMRWDIHGLLRPN